MTTTTANGSKHNAFAIARRAYFLAWTACGSPHMMGVLQDRPGATEADVWRGVCEAPDYEGFSMLRAKQRDGVLSINADYVFGRMMKLRAEVREDEFRVTNHSPFEPYYQAFAGTYPTPEALTQAAIASLDGELVARGN